MENGQSWLIPTYSVSLPSGDYHDRRCTQEDHWGVRVIFCQDEHVILVQHQEPGASAPFWLFPGGGVELGERVAEAGVREFKEETGLDVRIESLVYIREALPSEIEFYVFASHGQGMMALGTDPEKQTSVLRDVDHVSFARLRESQDFVLYPRTLQQRLEQDSLAGWPTAYYIGDAQ